MNEDQSRVERERKKRLTPVYRIRELDPWRRAYELETCFLYWISVNTFPIAGQQRQWLMHFFDGLTAFLRSDFKLRPEVFVQMKVIHPRLVKPFLNSSAEFSPLMGLIRRPGAVFPEPLTETDMRAIADGDKEFAFNNYVPDYTYWFVDKSERKQRELFFGHGGMTITFMKPDPKTKPPELPYTPAFRAKQPILQKIDVDRAVARTFALMDGFRDKSKELFGTGLESHPQFKGLPFILPLLNASNFFDQSPEDCDRLFQICDVYIIESPDDKGILMASKTDFEEPMIELLERMKEENLRYSEW